MNLTEKVTQLTEQGLTDENQFLVSVSVSALKGPQKVTVIIDGDKGVTIDDCAAISRKLSDQLEEQGLIGDNFTLEVTTPGIDKPLKLHRQYVKNIGRGLKVQMIGKEVLSGKLVAVTESEVTLEEETGKGKNTEIKKTSLPFSQIESAFVQILFK